MKVIHKSISTFITVVTPATLLATPVYAHRGGRGEVNVSIPDRQFTESYDAYDNQDVAKQCAQTFYVDECEFPVKVTLKGSKGREKSYEFYSYGSQTIELKDWGVDTVLSAAMISPTGVGPIMLFRDEPIIYSTIIVAPPESKPVSNIRVPSNASNTPAEEINPQCITAAEILIQGIDLPTFAKDDAETYIKDLSKFYAGEWDGDRRWLYGSTYTSRQYINTYTRTYHWYATAEDGVSYDLECSIDYIGALQTVVGQDFTLTIDYEAGIIEQWVAFERQNCWQIPLLNASISKVYPAGFIGADFQGIVLTNGSDGQHRYCLLPNDIVE